MTSSAYGQSEMQETVEKYYTPFLQPSKIYFDRLCTINALLRIRKHRLSHDIYALRPWRRPRRANRAAEVAQMARLQSRAATIAKAKKGRRWKKGQIVQKLAMVRGAQSSRVPKYSKNSFRYKICKSPYTQHRTIFRWLINLIQPQPVIKSREWRLLL